VNFVGPPKIALTGGFTLKEAKTLHTTYWYRNRSVKQIAASCEVIVVRGQMWLFNPVSKFYYSLRAEKDKFSTLNQGTGVFCFDTWVRHVRATGIKITMQYHDEIVFQLPLGNREKARTYLLEAIAAANESLKLNVPLAISVDFGASYADIH